MKKSILTLLAVAASCGLQAQSHTWDFTNWSDETKANLAAGAFEKTNSVSPSAGWSDVEKSNGTEPTVYSKNNCFWQVAASVGLKANDVDIAELSGLDYTSTTDRSLAIAVNYGDSVGAGFGPYHGPSYLWLGGKDIAYFTIHNVRRGSIVTMGVESHRVGNSAATGDARGVKLTVNGTELTDSKGNSVTMPTAFTEQSWLVPTLEGDSVADIVVTNSNGCHLYYIDAEIVTINVPAEEETPGESEGEQGGESGESGEDTVVYVYKEKVLYTTNFQDWDDLSGSTTAKTVTKTMTDGNELVFTFFNANVDADGTNDKFTGEDCTPGYIQTNKDATNVPYITLSAIDSLSSFELVQAATGGTRGVTVYVKGEGDADWVELHNKSVSNAAGETLSFTVNKKNCQIKFSDFAPAQNSYILSLKISGYVKVPQRKFTDFALDFTTDPYTVTLPEDGVLPAGVEFVSGAYYNSHGYSKAVVKFITDGPVEISVGGCNYTGTATVTNNAGETLATLQTSAAGCDGVATYTFNYEKADTLTVNCGSYCPSLKVVACDFIPSCTVTYYDSDGKTVIGEEVVEGNSALAFKYSESDVTVADGYKFRGWFNSKLQSGLKVSEGIALTTDTKLYAHTTEIEVAEVGKIFNYDLTKNYFYQEDHEIFSISNGSYYNNHGWLIQAGGSFSVDVAGISQVVLTLCQYGTSGAITVTNAAGDVLGTIENSTAESDGGQTTFNNTGDAATLTFTFANATYFHGVKVYNVTEIPTINEATGYYIIAASDAAGLILAINAANATGNVKIYLPNGTYDFGETVLTTISGNNISLIGESMTGTIIKNAPLLEDEGISKTATILNTSNNLYLQDLTLQNAMAFNGGTGRAVALQDKGTNTICKNVRLLSYQDTYYSNKASNFYWEDCEIHGVVDYICGDGDVVYNRTKFVNEKIKNTTMAAPYTSENCTWGYVLLDCEIETLCSEFNLGRSWGGNSALQYIRCKDLSDKLVSSRWTTDGMNVAAYKFKEYKMMNSKGEITTPSSNIVNFTHSSGNKKYETVLTDEEAAQYTVANIYGAWQPDSICAQVEDVNLGTVYLVDGQITTVAPAEGTTVRIANSRGGFGPAVAATGIKSIEAKTVNGTDRAYDLAGRKATDKGLMIRNGKVVMMK